MTKKPNWLESHQKDWHGFTIWFTSALCCLAQMCKANTHICQVKIKKTGKSEKYRPYEKENTKYFQAKIHTFLKCTNYDKH